MESPFLEMIDRVSDCILLDHVLEPNQRSLIKPRGELWKLTKGISRNGPATRPKSISCLIFSSTTVVACRQC